MKQTQTLSPLSLPLLSFSSNEIMVVGERGQLGVESARLNRAKTPYPLLLAPVLLGGCPLYQCRFCDYDRYRSTLLLSSINTMMCVEDDQVAQCTNVSMNHVTAIDTVALATDPLLQTLSSLNADYSSVLLAMLCIEQFA